MSIRSNHKEQIGILVVFVGILLFFTFIPTSDNQNIIGQAYQDAIYTKETINEINNEQQTTYQSQAEIQKEQSEITQYFLEGVQSEQVFFKNTYYGLEFESSSSKGGISLDFDNDGDKDFIVYGDSFNYLFLNNIDKTKLKADLLNDNKPLFVQLKIFNEQELSKQHTEIILSNDFNDDGLIDFFVGNYGGDSFIYYGKGTITTENIQSKIKNKNEFDDFKDNFNEVLLFSQKYVKSAEIYDINNDGKDDLIIANYNQPNEIYLNNKESFEKLEGQVLDLKPNGDYTYDIKLQDLNNDGKTDIIFGTNDGIYMFFNQNGNFNLEDFYKIEIKNIRKLTLSDLNQDKEKDLLVSVYSGRDEYYLKTDSKQIFELLALGEQKNTLDIIKFEEIFLTIIYNGIPEITLFDGKIVSFIPFDTDKGFFNSAIIEDFDEDSVLDIILFSDKEDKLIFNPINQ